jgi:hypothetical protein
MVKTGWNPIKELVKKLPGEYEYPVYSDEKTMLSERKKKNFILLVFIGGITYNEIAAVRYLNKTMKGKIKNLFYYILFLFNRFQIYNNYYEYY